MRSTTQILNDINRQRIATVGLPPQVSEEMKLYGTIAGIGLGASVLAYIFNWLLGKDGNPVRWLGLVGAVAAGIAIASVANVLANWVYSEIS